jgi:hypothetical protein
MSASTPTPGPSLVVVSTRVDVVDIDVVTGEELVAAASPPEPTRSDIDANPALTATTTTAEASHQRH